MYDGIDPSFFSGLEAQAVDWEENAEASDSNTQDNDVAESPRRDGPFHSGFSSPLC